METPLLGCDCPAKYHQVLQRKEAERGKRSFRNRTENRYRVLVRCTACGVRWVEHQAEKVS